MANSESARDYRLQDDGVFAEITAKYWPDSKEFRVYQVRGDVTNLPWLRNAINNLISELGFDVENVTVNL